MAFRKLTQVVRGHPAVDGAGVRLQRVLGARTMVDFDPFLMLDGFDSLDPRDYIAGFPWHPHRGIETVTYLLEGELEHGDSLGNSGVIGKLQCQWMTAGSGIIHQEMPQAAPRMLGCQLWVNLPASEKMTEPAYRDIQSSDVSEVAEENALVRVLSGRYSGKIGAVKGEYVPVQYLDVALQPEAVWEYNQTPNDQTLDAIDKRLEELQTELLKLASSKADYEDVADEIYRLREEKQKVQLDNVGRDELKKRITDMGDFLRKQPTAITEYDEPLVRRLIEKVTVYEDKFTVEFKSGVTVDVDE